MTKSADRILDKAADLLEAEGWVKFKCYQKSDGKMCALGAIAAVAEPKVYKTNPEELNHIGLREPEKLTPVHAQAVRALARHLQETGNGSVYGTTNVEIVYNYNDQKVVSSELVVAALREAADKFRAAVAAI